MNADLVAVAIELAFWLLVIGVFVVRNLAGGRVRYERIDRDNSGSALVANSVLQMGYWLMQPAGRWLARLGATPNALSWTALLLGAVTGALLAAGHFGFATVVATASVFLDSLDGMVARLRNLSSAAGEVLDTTVDRYVELFFIAGLGLHYADRPWALALSFAALGSAFMVSYTSALFEAAGMQQRSGLMRRAERCVYLLAGSGFSALTAPLEDRAGWHDTLGAPMLLALLVIAVAGTLAAGLRLRTLARELRRRETAAASAEPAEPAAQQQLARR